MSGCLDNVQCRMPECCESITARRNAIASIGAGFFFFVGWWVIIDAACIYPTNAEFAHVYHIIGVVSTIAFFVVNAVSNSHIRGENYTDGCLGQIGARIWLFVGFLMAFGGLIASLWVLFQVYVIHVDPELNPYPGVALFLQNFFIFIAGIIFKFGRTEDQWE